MGSDHKSDTIATNDQDPRSRPQQVELSDPDTGEIIGVALETTPFTQGDFQPGEVIPTNILPTSEQPQPDPQVCLDADEKSSLGTDSLKEDANFYATTRNEVRLDSQNKADQDYWPDPRFDASNNRCDTHLINGEPEEPARDQAPILEIDKGLFQSKGGPDEEYWPEDSVEPSDLVVPNGTPIDGWFVEQEWKSSDAEGSLPLADATLPLEELPSTISQDNLGESYQTDRVKPQELFSPSDEETQGEELGVIALTADASKQVGEIKLDGTTPVRLSEMDEQTVHYLTSTESSTSDRSAIAERAESTTVQSDELIDSFSDAGSAEPEAIDTRHEQSDSRYKSDDIRTSLDEPPKPGAFDMQSLATGSALEEDSNPAFFAANEVENDCLKVSEELASSNEIDTQRKRIDSTVLDIDETEDVTEPDAIAVGQVGEIKFGEAASDLKDESDDQASHNPANPISSYSENGVADQTEKQSRAPTSKLEEPVNTSSDEDRAKPGPLNQEQSDKRTANNDVKKSPDGRYRSSEDDIETLADGFAEQKSVVDGLTSKEIRDISVEDDQLIATSIDTEVQLELVDLEVFELDEIDEDALEDDPGNDFSRTDQNIQSFRFLPDEVGGGASTDELESNSSELGFQWDEQESFDAGSDGAGDSSSNDAENDWLFQEWTESPNLQDEVEFRSHANQFHDVSLPWRISELSALLVENLPIFRTSEQEEAFYEISEILKEFPTGSSHAAIARVVSRGASLEDIFEIAALKRHWHESEELWLKRSLFPGQAPTTFLDTKRGPSLLTWSTANKLLKFGSSSEIVDVMLPEWRTAWIDLRLSDELLASSEWYSFSAYLGAIAKQKEFSNCIDYECDWSSSLPEIRIENDYKIIPQESLIARETDFCLRETLLNTRSRASAFVYGSSDEENS